MQNYLIVFFGAGLGGAVRYGVNAIALHLLGAGFPFGTLAVNIAGSFAMGLVFGWNPVSGGHNHAWQLFLTTGFLGGFTTFSAFSLDTALLYEQGQWWLAAVYVFASVTIALLGLFAGMAAVRLVS